MKQTINDKLQGSVTLPVVAAERACSWYTAPEAVDPHLLSAGRSAANLPPAAQLLQSIDGTDGRTEARPFHKPWSAYYK